MGSNIGNGEKGRDGRDGRDGVEHSPNVARAGCLAGSKTPKLERCSLLRRHDRHAVTPSRPSGFTLVEILVVLAILAFLLSVAVPRYFGSLDRSKETVLRDNLFQVRESLDQYFSDTGRYPDKIEDLVARHYLRAAPVDPVTGSTTTWVVVPPRELDKGGVFDIRSGAA